MSDLKTSLKSALDSFADSGFEGLDDEDMFTTTPTRSRGGNDHEDINTPPLSLPDSFDNGDPNEYGGYAHTGNREAYESKAMKDMKAEVNRVLGLMSERSSTFRDLTISEQMYNDLRLRPESDLTTFELAQLKSHEFTSKYRKDMEALRRTLTDTQGKLVDATSRADEAESALARSNKITKLETESMKTEIQSLEERCTRLSVKLKEESSLRQDGDEKALMYDRTATALATLQKEHDALKGLYETQATSLANLTVQEAASRNAEKDAERAKELLAMDKAYLSQELRAAEGRADQASKNNEANQSKVVQLEMKVSALSDQLLNAQLDSRKGIEDRIEKETARIREDSIREMAALKEANREIMEREVKVLREAKESADTEVERLKSTIVVTQTENVKLQTEIIGLGGKHANDTAELRAEIKLKSFELTTLGASFEERMKSYRQLEAEIDATKAELHVHKGAFVKLEADANIRQTELSSQLKVAMNRLAAYEALEEEIDGAVLRVAQAGDIQNNKENAFITNDGTLTSDVENDMSKSFFSNLKAMPSQPERRARQAVLLAQKVLEAEKQRDLLKKEVKSLLTDLKAAESRESAAETALTRSSQPTIYLVTKLRDEEAAHTVTKSKIQSLEEEIRDLQQDKQRMQKDNENIKERLTLILHQRADIDKIRDVLETIQERGMVSNNVHDEEDLEVEMKDFAQSLANTSYIKPTAQSVAAGSGSGSPRHTEQSGQRSPRNAMNSATSKPISTQGATPSQIGGGGLTIDTGSGSTEGANEGAQDTTREEVTSPGKNALNLSEDEIRKMTTSPNESKGKKYKFHTREEL